MSSAVRLVDGSWDFSGGVNSGVVPTISSDLVPNGLRRDQIAWGTNLTCRTGGLLQRTGWTKLARLAEPGVGLFQGGWMYEPRFGDPYLMCSIAGRIIQCRVDTDNSVHDLSAIFGLSNPPNEPQTYWIEGEEFAIIQAGDFGHVPTPTLPLFWDNITLRRSIGITTSIPSINPGQNEIPAATCMDYYMGRIWYALGRDYGGGDIVKEKSGTLAFDFRDAILNVTESPLIYGGDNFTVPSNAGDIRAIAHASTLDTVLGDGPLFVFTRKAVYKMTVPVTRASWVAMTTDNIPTQTLALKANGTYSDRSVVAVNGDLFFQGPLGISSLNMAIRYFQQWGNIPISNNENRVLQFNNRALMRFSSGILFDNRLWQTALPVQTPAGVAFQGIIPLDFDLISTLDKQLPPAWEGMYEGLDVLQLFQGDFGGRFRAFAVVCSKIDQGIDLWELTDSERTDNGGTPETQENRVVWFAETAAYEFQQIKELKRLDGGEIWIDKLFCSLDIEVSYRVDADPCWQFWHRQTICSARNSCEDVNNPTCYPEQPFRESFKFPVTLPVPPFPNCQGMNKRPMNVGYQFQVRIAMKGWARIRGVILYAVKVEHQPFAGLNC